MKRRRMGLDEKMRRAVEPDAIEETLRIERRPMNTPVDVAVPRNPGGPAPTTPASGAGPTDGRPQTVPTQAPPVS